jgi:hypothetical protein
LLRQGKIDIERLERLQRNHLLTRGDHLPDIYQPDAELPVERRAHFFLHDHRSHVADRPFLLLEFRFGGIELRF